MDQSKRRAWSLFVVWLVVAVLGVALFQLRHGTILTPLYGGLLVLFAVVKNWKSRPRNYKFELARPGLVRSALGFEVRMLSSRLEYAEGDHVISWQASPAGPSVGRFKLSEGLTRGRDDPFAGEPMHSDKKRDLQLPTKP